MIQNTNQTPTAPCFIRRSVVAQRLGVTVSTVRNWMEGPDPIPSVKIRGTVLIPATEFEDWFRRLLEKSTGRQP